MNKKIDLTVLLKDCPSGMELDCLMYEDVYFDYVDERNIIHCYIQHETHKTSITFNQYGTHNNDIKSKCVIFPKGKTTWEGFKKPFVDGDVVMFGDDQFAIFKEYIEHLENEGELIRYYVYYDAGEDYLDVNGLCCIQRLAAEEEKSELFQVIKDNGYKWNPETKTLEKLIVPKFKSGDMIVKKDDPTKSWYVQGIETYYSDHYCIITKGMFDNLYFKDQDEWELLVTIPKFKVGDKIKHRLTGDVYKILFVQSNEYGGGNIFRYIERIFTLSNILNNRCSSTGFFHYFT